MNDQAEAPELHGTVTPFKGDGRRLGYPTANLAVDTAAQDGVYFGFADLADYRHHPSIIFVGTPTTLGESRRRVEAYLLDIPDKDYYHLPMSLKLEHYHRANRTFPDVAELIDVMKADEAAARSWFGSRGGPDDT